jgi:hypothetical protein
VFLRVDWRAVWAGARRVAARAMKARRGFVHREMGKVRRMNFLGSKKSVDAYVDSR